MGSSSIQALHSDYGTQHKKVSSLLLSHLKLSVHASIVQLISAPQKLEISTVLLAVLIYFAPQSYTWLWLGHKSFLILFSGLLDSPENYLPRTDSYTNNVNVSFLLLHRKLSEIAKIWPLKPTHIYYFTVSTGQMCAMDQMSSLLRVSQGCNQGVTWAGVLPGGSGVVVGDYFPAHSGDWPIQLLWWQDYPTSSWMSSGTDVRF